MSRQWKILRRLLAAVICLLVMFSAVMILGAIEAYYKQGAEAEPMLHLTKDLLTSHHPEVAWLPDSKNLEGEINMYLRASISEAYAESWHMANLCLKNKSELGLADYFGERLAEAQKAAFPSNDTKIERVDLKHHLKLHLLSLDKRLVAFSDSAVWLKKSIQSHPEGPAIVQDFQHSYSVIMTLEDGRWRVIEMHQEQANSMVSTASPTNTTNLDTIEAINYYPPEKPWKLFWSAYDHDLVERDFGIIQALKYNAVRVFIPFDEFGGARVKQKHLENLLHLLDIASCNDLSVIVTLFDFPVGFSLDKYTAYDSQLRSIVPELSGHKALILYDLKNEPDIDFRYHEEAEVLRWLAHFVKRIKDLDAVTPVTIGWASIEHADKLQEELDIVSFHYYGDADKLGSKIDVLKQAVGAKPILLSEYGMSSYRSLWYPIGNSLEKRQSYLSEIEAVIAEKELLGAALWCYSDFEEVPSYVAGSKPWIKATQSRFGLLDENLELK